MSKKLKILVVLLAILSSILCFVFVVNADYDNITEYPFVDVTPGVWYENSTIYCFEHGYLQGTTLGVFSPDVALTRSMAVQILYSIYGDNSKYTKVNTFSDVPSNSWYHNACEWAYANGITSGVGDGKFAPSKKITRQDFAVMIYKFHELTSLHHASPQNPENATISDFSDYQEISVYAKDAVEWACNYGLLTGTNAGTLIPKTSATRSQAACIIYSFERLFWHCWYINSIDSERTCTNDGVVKYRCIECSVNRTVKLPAYHCITDYSYVSGSCELGVTLEKHCINCDYEEQKTEYREHKWGLGEVYEGKITYSCQICRTKYSMNIKDHSEIYYVSELSVDTDGVTPNGKEKYGKYHQEHTSYYDGVLDAEKNAYVVLPTGYEGEAKLGDFAVVVDRRTGNYVYCIIGDIGNRGNPREVSIKVCWDLGYNTNGFWGPDGDFLIIFYPGTKQNWVKDTYLINDEINEVGRQIF